MTRSPPQYSSDMFHDAMATCFHIAWLREQTLAVLLSHFRADIRHHIRSRVLDLQPEQAPEVGLRRPKLAFDDATDAAGMNPLALVELTPYLVTRRRHTSKCYPRRPRTVHDFAGDVTFESTHLLSVKYNGDLERHQFTFGRGPPGDVILTGLLKMDGGFRSLLARSNGQIEAICSPYIDHPCPTTVSADPDVAGLGVRACYSQFQSERPF